MEVAARVAVPTIVGESCNSVWPANTVRPVATTSEVALISTIGSRSNIAPVNSGDCAPSVLES